MAKEVEVDAIEELEAKENNGGKDWLEEDVTPFVAP